MTNANLIAQQEMSGDLGQGGHPLETMKVCTKFHGNPIVTKLYLLRMWIRGLIAVIVMANCGKTLPVFMLMEPGRC